MGQLQMPVPFNMNELFLDVSLKTCVNGSSRDFTGRKTFNTKFYRENIGFGITDISVEINPSLQPIVDITFKDLYGNTLYGTQRTADDEIDTSVLFDWPHPKFIFSFKGFLGRKVTWLLNLKTTNISYVPSDGSYDVKCSFVPNQWGFLADIPVLYLLACKKLRYEAYGKKNVRYVTPTFFDKDGNEFSGTEKCEFKTDSVFSYSRIGKQVEVKTDVESKEFELLRKQLGSIKYGLSSAVFGAKVISIDEPIVGVIKNIEIPGFTNLKVSAGGSNYDDLERLYKNSNNSRSLDTYLLLNIKRGATNNAKDTENIEQPVSNTSFSSSVSDLIKGLLIKSENDVDGQNREEIEKAKKAVFDIVDNNLLLIEKEIKKRVYSAAKSQISKLTIGEIFKEISRDSGFILGSILQAGFNGYFDNLDVRNGENAKKEIIGKSFPLYVTPDGEEVPAVSSRESSASKASQIKEDYGTVKNGCEMDFVEKFIQAIGEGIAENLLSDDVAMPDDIVKNRINNIEAIQPNPYKPFYTDIIENILIRSGIIAFVTRSSNPNKPGDYPQPLSRTNDRVSSIISLAESDMENLTKDILGQLSFEEIESLKRFCTFFDRLIGDEEISSGPFDLKPGMYFKDPKGFPVLDLGKELKDPNTPVPDSVLDFPVIVSINPDVRQAVDSLTEEFSMEKLKEIQKLALESEVLTLRKVVGQILSGKRISGDSYIQYISGATETEKDDFSEIEEDVDVPSFYNTSAINASTLTAVNVKNNGIHYSIPFAQNNKYYFVLFDQPSDAIKTKEISVDDATTEGDLDGEGKFNTRDDYPIGFVQIEDGWESKFHSGEAYQGITVINDRITDYQCLNYSKCKTYYQDYRRYLQDETKTIQDKEIKSPIQLQPKNLAYTVYTHTVDRIDESRNLVFGPLYHQSGDNRSRNQRLAILTMCKSILRKIDEIETERNEIIASVFGKADESRDSIYKQMHTIFHQWQVIASSLNDGDPCLNYQQVKDDSLSLRLEEEFGMCSNHVNRGNGDKNLKEYSTRGNTLFVYDYPLAPVNQKNPSINVRNSVINIEPLYKPNGNTTILNTIQQICTKNNFIFVPFPGDSNSDNINEIYSPSPTYKGDEKIKNYFHVMFAPTPETRSKLNNNKEFVTDYMRDTDFQNKAIGINFGGVDNQIIKNINVSTDSTKPTAESILNLQRLVDKDNSRKTVSMDCSMLPVYEGRSYKTKIDMIGNAQVYPMQYFYIQKNPMFGGLYQIMKVNHSITPNDMSTTVEGVRMRFSTEGRYGGIEPITLEYLASLGEVSSPMAQEFDAQGSLGAVRTVAAGAGIVMATKSSIEAAKRTIEDLKIGNTFDTNAWQDYSKARKGTKAYQRVSDGRVVNAAFTEENLKNIADGYDPLRQYLITDVSKFAKVTFNVGSLLATSWFKFSPIPEIFNTKEFKESLINPVYANGNLQQYITHPGLDYNSSRTLLGKQKVRCIYEGVIDTIASDSTSGGYIVVKHTYKGNSFYSLYMHLGKPTAGLKIGKDVAKGDILSVVANTGSANTCNSTHLHFELRGTREKKIYYDPIAFLHPLGINRNFYST